MGVIPEFERIKTKITPCIPLCFPVKNEAWPVQEILFVPLIYTVLRNTTIYFLQEQNQV